jgi:hypothetical protein
VRCSHQKDQPIHRGKEEDDHACMLNNLMVRKNLMIGGKIKLHELTARYCLAKPLPYG